MDKVLLLGGHRKSGTTLLHSLFDGHKEIFAPPHDLNILYAYYPEWTKQQYSHEERKDRLEKVILIDWLNFYKKVTTDREFENIALKMNDYFQSNIDKYDLGAIEEVLNFALKLITELAPAGKKVVVIKETSSEIYATRILSNHPNWLFLHLFRDPRDNFAALKAGQSKKYSKLGDKEIDTISSTIFRYKMGYNWKKININVFGTKRYNVLRFEDLVKEPEKQMRKIVDWLGLIWNDSLIEPTRFGKTFEGNNHSGKKFKGISTANLGRWTERISDKEAATLEACLGEEMQELNYKRVFEEKKIGIEASEWYAHMNYEYFFSDRFSSIKSDS